MVEVTVMIPEEMKDIAAETSETLYIEAFKEVSRKKMADYQKRLDELKEKIAIYENTYEKSFEEFSRSVPDTLKGHDDWIEWTYLVHVAGELENKVNKLNILLG
jgi:hypothetical protein